MNKEKNHTPYTLSAVRKWKNCPSSKRVPTIIYGKGGIGKTSFGDNMNMNKINLTKEIK